jgi:hypothetical protein
MKGFEVRFRGKSVEIAVNESISLSIIAQKVHGKMNISVGGWLIDADTHPVWISADDLKLGDEIIIERKEVRQSAAPLLPPSDFDPNCPLMPKEKQDMQQYMLRYFRELERLLQKEGFIDE